MVETEEHLDAVEAAQDRRQRRLAAAISVAALATVLAGSLLVVLQHA